MVQIDGEFLEVRRIFPFRCVSSLPLPLFFTLKINHSFELKLHDGTEENCFAAVNEAQATEWISMIQRYTCIQEEEEKEEFPDRQVCFFFFFFK